METSESTICMNNYDKLKIENEKLIEEISILKKEIYDLKNLHVHLTIKEELKCDSELDEEVESEGVFESRDDMSPYEQMTINKEHLKYMWETKNLMMKNERPKINENMSDLEKERREEALIYIKKEDEESEIEDIMIEDDVYLTDGLLVVVDENQELGEIVDI